jgi:hypothetical protein
VAEAGMFCVNIAKDDSSIEAKTSVKKYLPKGFTFFILDNLINISFNIALSIWIY